MHLPYREVTIDTMAGSQQRVEFALVSGFDGEAYAARLSKLEASGAAMHGEADLISAYSPRRVLDAGCGTGRVALELARRGIDVVGVDIDDSMLRVAHRLAAALDGSAPRFVRADLADAGALLTIGVEPASFDVVVMAGNVLLFVVPGTEQAVVTNLARAVEPGGMLIAGFSLVADRIDLAQFDAFASAVGLTLDARFATWDRTAWEGGGDYAVSVHRKLA
jgi:SAM-dependent methyltransferase